MRNDPVASVSVTTSGLRWPFDRTSVFEIPTAYAELRKISPIVRVELWDGREAFLLTRYSDVRAVMSSPTLSANVHLDGFPCANAASLASKRLQRSFVRMDPPAHDTQRAVVAREFSATKVRRYYPAIEAYANELVERMLTNGSPCDLVASFARPLPSRVVSALLSISLGDAAMICAQVVAWSGADSSSAVAAGDEVLRFLNHLLDTTTGSNDLVGRVRLNASSRDEAVQILFLLVVAGFHTTANMISLAVVVAMEFQLFSVIAAQPQASAPIVDELLRFVSVAQHTALRLAVQDTQLPSGLVRTGDAIIAPIPAANHDPHWFPQPHLLRLDRDHARHLAFGAGIHNCLGQRLARVELGIALRILAQRMPGVQLAVPADALEYTSGATYGLRALPVRW